jgi:hypothetical protein
MRTAAPTWGVADQAVARLLCVRPKPRDPDAPADQLLGLAVLLSGVRCIIRYAILPFGLPLLGLAAGATRGISLAFDLIAVVAAITSLRRMWAIQHPQRWRYLLIAVGVLLVTTMFVFLDTVGVA